MQVFCCPPLPVLVLWAGRGPPATARSLLTTPLGSRRLSLSCLGLESARKRSRTKVVTVAAAAAVGPRQVPSWDFPLSPSSPASVSPPPASSSSQARPSPARRRASGTVGEWSRTVPWAATAPLPFPAMGPLPGEEGGHVGGAQVSPSSLQGPAQSSSSSSGFRAGPGPLLCPEEIITLSLSPAVAQAGIWILTCKEPLLAGGAGGRATAILPNSGREGKGAQFLPPHSHLSLLLPQTPPTGPRAGGPCIQWKVRLPTPSPAN